LKANPQAGGEATGKARPPKLLERDPLELAAGTMLGVDPSAPPLPTPTASSARSVLEQEVLAALARPPCVIGFSGGRNSSAMLAIATAVARREGQPEPIPLTWRFPAHPSTDESDWQELVIRRLGLRERERLRFGEELEVLGEMATATLRTHGLLWPPACHVYLPALERATGGSLLVAEDGHDLLDRWPFARAQAVLHGRARPEARDVLRVGAALAPLPIRRRVGAGYTDAGFPWLRVPARREVVRRRGGRLAEPRRWDRWIAWRASHRTVRMAVQSLEMLAAAHDVATRRPLLSPRFLATIAREGGAAGLGRRPELARRLFGDLVPAEVLGRPGTKAEFGPVLWGSRSRAFAEAWDGSGVDHELIDADRLREIWAAEPRWLRASAVAQSAWLASANA
jgi:hypothetical protein